MAIIDRNGIFFEGALTTTATGAPVCLSALRLPGRMEPMPLRISVTEAFDPAELERLDLTLEEADTPDAATAPEASTQSPSQEADTQSATQQADAGSGQAASGDTWSAVAGAHWSCPAGDLGLGARLGPRFLPQGVRKAFLRLRLAPVPKSGKTVSRGRIFAALLREDEQPWVAELMVR